MLCNEAVIASLYDERLSLALAQGKKKIVSQYLILRSCTLPVHYSISNSIWTKSSGTLLLVTLTIQAYKLHTQIFNDLILLLVAFSGANTTQKQISETEVK